VVDPAEPFPPFVTAPEDLWSCPVTNSTRLEPNPCALQLKFNRTFDSPVRDLL
jgi:hypothetical protein